MTFIKAPGLDVDQDDPSVFSNRGTPMASIKHFLAEDHLRCDTLFAEAESAAHDSDWEKASKYGHEFIAGMEHHFAMEEGVLFPEFEAATGMTAGPTAVMRMEHAEMRRLLGEMSAALDARDADEFLGTAETMLVMMQQHNTKEEQILYPMAERVLGASATGMLERMQHIPA